MLQHLNITVEALMNFPSKVWGVVCLLAVFSSLTFVPTLHAGNGVLGQVDLVGATKVEETSGVWIDGQYLGYLNELKDDKKVLLLPGEHSISVRQAGYQNYDQRILVEPGTIQVLRIKMERDVRVKYSAVTAEVKLTVTPDRAAVFLDDAYAGHVSEFTGVGRAMLISPGKHRIKIALPGYQTFETEINLLPKQKFEVKTDLVKGSITDSGPLIKTSQN